MTDLRGRFVEQIRQDGGSLSPELAAAFATVPREVFVADGFLRRDGTWAMPDARDFLDLVYRDDVLVTKVEGTLPVSSSSQPSLMAIMIEALAFRPGMRILEIGAGTGYNAALLSALGAHVTSVDVQPDVAARARAALEHANIANAAVVLGDGYTGVPAEHFDRVLVTVGVAGISPRWLCGGGLVVVPVEHAGMHPVLAVRGTAGGPVTATVICPSGFMSAAGPLTAHHAHPSPAPAGTLGVFSEVAPARWDPPLDSLAYRDLWYAAGVWNRRASHASLRRDQSNLALLDETRTGGAIILPTGAILAGGDQAEQYAADATEILNRWESAGRPAMQAWHITLTLTEAPDTPIWVPTGWSLNQQAGAWGGEAGVGGV
jgi:protein-L-isoaspartate(D-aspartate) O-methyltransferase